LKQNSGRQIATLSAVRFNPAVRALYARVVAKHPDKKAIAIGHAMRKLLHLAFAIWKSKKPFDKTHYPWDTPAHVESAGTEPKDEQVAGLTRTAEPAQKEVPTTCTENLPHDEPAGQDVFIDFAHVKKQLPIARVFEHLGLSARLRGPGAQKRCACPIHRADGRGRTFSVNLDANAFHCFDANCQKKGDVIDLWAALHQQDLRQAALDLVRTFALEPAQPKRTEKRHG
jgi:CHC2 zinc finger